MDLLGAFVVGFLFGVATLWLYIIDVFDNDPNDKDI